MTISHHKTALFVIAGLVPALLLSAGLATAGSDPTQGRIQQRRSQAMAEYHECAGFALRVFQGAMSQAGGVSAKIRAARSHYEANLARCRARFL